MNSSDRGGAISIPADEFVPSDAAKNKAKSVVSQIIKSNMSDYDCVKAIHDYVVKNVNYDVNGISTGAVNDTSHPSHTAESALCNGLAVCDGYAQAFELLCAEAGIYAYMMYGEGTNPGGGVESHAWNVVKIDGEWYQIDCTWDDPTGMSEDYISYENFLLADHNGGGHTDSGKANNGRNVSISHGHADGTESIAY